MAGHQDVWRTEPDGSVAAEVGGYRLVVHPPERAGGPARFLLLRLGGRDDDPPALVGSGTEADVRTAMRTAARMADRLVERRPGGGPLRRAP